MKRRLLCIGILLTYFGMSCGDRAPTEPPAPSVETPELLVRRADHDFNLSGDGSSRQWNLARWVPLQTLHGHSTYETWFKTLYSDTGIYFLFYCEDALLTATITEDYGPLYDEDVVEVFLWPYEGSRVYFEYEISPLGYELPLMVVNHDGARQGWLPWNAEGDRAIRRATAVFGGDREPMARVRGWQAEFFIPFKLLHGMGHVPPESGTRWRANMCRIDYDDDPTFWTWSELDAVNFHLIEQFGTLVFE